jgi:ATP-dependent Clp protease ATP-binding subunit ClpC
LTDTEHAMCAVAAAKAGQRIDVWMREKVLDAAREHPTDTE